MWNWTISLSAISLCVNTRQFHAEVFFLQAGRAASRAWEPRDFPSSRRRRRATSRAPATSWASATSPPATSPWRITQQASATATSPTVTWPSWWTRSGPIRVPSGSTRFPGASAACWTLSRCSAAGVWLHDHNGFKLFDNFQVFWHQMGRIVC